ncbi:serine hydrolase-like protein [Homarus americanus]|nr:serine hydrolase-like protein [Homarus americanus]
MGVHGWLDNANTFDTLVPLLPLGVEVLVFDLPGHGLSDHMPLGARYDIFTYVFSLHTAVRKLEWKKFVFMGHSMGSAISCYFIALFPEYVGAFISLDLIKPVIRTSRLESFRNDALKLFKTEDEKRQPIVYSESEAIDRLTAARYMGGANSIQDSAHILLLRSGRKVEGGYVWNHDPRAYSNFNGLFYGNSIFLEAISSITCPVMIVRASKGMCNLPDSVYRKELDVYQSNAQWLDIATVEGTHHVHLSHPERVAPLVSGFLQKLGQSSPKDIYSKL